MQLMSKHCTAIRWWTIAILTSILLIRVYSECVVYGANDLVHALHVALAGVQLGVEEQHALDHLPVSLAAFIQWNIVTTVHAVRTADLVAQLPRYKNVCIYVVKDIITICMGN